MKIGNAIIAPIIDAKRGLRPRLKRIPMTKKTVAGIATKNPGWLISKTKSIIPMTMNVSPKPSKYIHK